MPKLGNIAAIRTGYPFRGKIERVEGDERACGLVQMGDVSGGTGEVRGKLARVKPPSNWEKHRVVLGDVVFVARGERNAAAVLVREADEVIAAPYLYVLHLKEGAALPGYVAWFLNLRETQEKMRKVRAGSSVPFVPIGGLAGLEIPLPGIEVQRKIAEVHRLSMQEQGVWEALKERRRELVEGRLREAVRRETNE
jgi:hypothetical protein